VSVGLTFLGAAGTVTGSKHLVSAAGARLLLDCGLFQGAKALRERNWAPPPIAPASLGAVLLSHAHVDHAGYLPRLVRDGFAGPVFCTRATADLLRILLPDAGALQEEDADYANRHGSSRHRPALPLFTAADAERALDLLRPLAFGESFAPARGARARFLHSGHILGAALIELSVAGRLIVFSGDLGRYDVPIMRDPEPLPAADVLLLESTYGDRLHADEDPAGRIVEAVGRAAEVGGWLVIPAFAVGRTQSLLYALRELEEARRIPPLPVYLDSPMAIEATVVYALHPEEHDAGAGAVSARGGRPFAPSRLRLTRTAAESKRLNGMEGPGIVIAGSGMCTGGRVLHHLRRLLPDARTTVLLVGFQASGTRGRLLRDGTSALRMLGETVAVRARVLSSDVFSAHADQAETLRWLRGFARPPGMTYLVHGEPGASAALASAVQRELGWAVRVAEDGQAVEV
jgi:metallo-beta-lactamase family protein